MSDTDPCPLPSPDPAPAPSLTLRWMQALIREDARLTQTDESVEKTVGHARDAVYYVKCGLGPEASNSGTDFLTAVARARKLVATGARRIVFLTFGDTPDRQLHRSLISFSRHARRALPANPAEFVVIPIDQAPSPKAPDAPRQP